MLRRRGTTAAPTRILETLPIGATRAGTAGGKTTAGAGTFDLSYPNSVVAGEFLIMMIAAATAISVTTPSGWTYDTNLSADDNIYTRFFYKFADGTETTNITVSTSGVTVAQIFSTPNVDQATPYETAPSKFVDPGGAIVSSVVMPTITATVKGAVFFYSMNSISPTATTFTDPPGATRVATITERAGITNRDTSAMSGTGSSGTRTVTLSPSLRMVGLGILLRPATAPPKSWTGSPVNVIFTMGDSMSSGFGASPSSTQWPNVAIAEVTAAKSLTPTWTAGGIGGSRLSTHRALAGGANELWTTNTNNFPASGSVILIPADSEMDLGESSAVTGLQFPASTPGGAAIAGTLTRSPQTHAGDIYFTRSTSGTAQTGIGSVYLTSDRGENNRANGMIYWGPHGNRPSAMPAGITGRSLGDQYILDTIAAIMAYRTGPYMIIGLSGGPVVSKSTNLSEWELIFGTSNGTIGGVNRAIRDLVGTAHWVDVFSGLLDTGPNGAWVYTGTTPTSQDLSDIADGYPGVSMRNTSGGDVGHLNSIGQAWVGHLVGQKILAEGWFG